MPLVTVGALGMLLMGFVVAVPSPGLSSGAGLDGRAVGQALAVDRLLIDGVASRVRLASAVDLATRCVRLDVAVAELAGTGEERIGQRELLEFLDLSRLPDGDRLRAALRVELLSAADTDAAFLAWARARQANGCDGDGVVAVSDDAFARARRVDATYRVATRAVATSTAAKAAFLDLWNPVATRFGLRIWSVQDI